MQQFFIKRYVRQVFGGVIFIYFLNKLLVRPYVIKHDFPEYLQIAVYSFPNLAEAIIGVLILTGILFYLDQYFSQLNFSQKQGVVYLSATVLAAFYVITQELKIHNIGGKNVIDPYDIAASVIGLILTWTLLHVFGFLKERP